MQQLQSHSAAPVWSFFENICAIPRPSKHEEQIRNWIINWAQENNIACVKDKIGNLILTKPAFVGYEDKTPVILQCHLDMVPQKNNDKEHNFLTDPIIPIIDGEWLRADNTTLGADNGIGMASCLAVLADSTIEHGPLEVLITTDEETGMTGAFGLEAGQLQGKLFINTDSEQEGELYVGCAGGVNVNVLLPFEKMETDITDSAYQISISGLKGGHSGVDINLGRANAIKELANVLTNLDAAPFLVSSLSGGSLRNAIPREAQAIIVCDAQYQNSLETVINTLQVSLRDKYRESESNFTITLQPCDLPSSVLTHQCHENLINALATCPNGIYSMDDSFPNVVETSSNLAVVTQQSGLMNQFAIQILIRSQIEEDKHKYAKQITTHFEQYEGRVAKEGNYPGWTPNKDSAIYKTMETQYEDLFGKKPKAMVIHAGLECGLFCEKYPHWDMISFGPTIKFPHSPDEKVEIASVDKYWSLLKATLKAID
ncbi:aminoacyl-histidine dipeptidase [Psychromonas sp. 14N.309.X.WAT.B.A12]|uniref:aminoacyl-histidine dipeptidase n=1 Tax=unclassified Psychromonas TaxID=2614957 RepID=UPI0025B10DCE|nr:aminoacyl-histidine dipeptidase [Psychromonas sp. 14N.309.X.WAT.B.A12]MDN2661874.1 aminoacyl-histidine dipeptidase [Psychromonas sp. 14N.309.X.WAT.B.A12]